jgi:alpha-L-rhamnosidase
MNIGHPSPVIAIVLAFTSVSFPSFAACSLNPNGLRCEYRSNPFGLGESQPRLDWQLKATDLAARGLSQTAYQVLVASSPEELANDKGDLWNTGKVDSDQTNQIEYNGAQLISREHCWWKVRVWDQAGQPSAWSQSGYWTMGLLDPSDWRAEWIGLDAAAPADGAQLTDSQRARIESLTMMQAPIPKSNASPLTVLVRRGFTLPSGRRVAKVTFAATVDQRCDVTVNGRRMAEIDRWEQVVPLDLTGAVTPGDNVLGLKITQEDGYPPALQGELEIDFADGGLVRLPVDATWHYAVTAPSGWDISIRPGENWGELVALAHHYRLNQFHYLAPAPFVRRSFTVAKAVRRATIYATALGDYELRINGSRVGHDYLTPGWTDYAHRVPYQAYDVTGMLRGGTNALGAIIGNGWYAGTMGNVGRRHYYGGYPRFLAQLEIEYADGTDERVVTDGSWRGSFGPILYADNLQGCAYDARLEFGDWATAGFDDSSWSPVGTGLRRVAAGPAPNLVLEADTIDPVRINDELPAKSITQPQPGVYLVDFGQETAGWVRLRASGRTGQKVTLRHGEMLNPNGTLYTSNLRGADATDIYWLRGGGEETLEPCFTFHGFRYVEITGLDAAPAPDSVTAMVAGTPIQRTGDFACSNPLLNRLFHNIIWSQRANYLETPTDCPQRDERLGWSGDAQFFIRTGAFNFDVALFIEKWLQAMRDGQGEEGTYYDVAPVVSDNPQKAITAWSGDAAVICTDALWRIYGDRRVIERNYDALARYLAWLEVSTQHGVSSVGGYGDWVNLGGGAKPEVMDTAYYSYLCGLMSEMATVIGRQADADRFADLRKQATAAFQDAFLRPDGSILDSSQTAYALAFTMDLLPETARAKAAEKFVDALAARNWHLATGFIGTPRLLPALHFAGRDDVAYRLLLQDTFPSWLFTVKNGATSMWERWDGWTPDEGFESIQMNSFNHYAFGSVGEFLYRFVGGIDTDGPGFRRILIQPQPGGTLTEAHANYDAITGRIEAGWRIEGDHLLVDAVIPPNTTATVSLPRSQGAQVDEGGRPVAHAPGIEPLGSGTLGQTFRVGSGTYHFTVQLPPKPASD